MKTRMWALAPSLAALCAVTVAFGQEQQPAPAPEGPGAPVAPRVRIVTLAQAQEMVAARSYLVRNIEETIVQADAMIGTAWSMLLPSIDANASITRNQREIAMQFPDWSTMAIDPATGELSMELQDMVIQEKWGKTFGLSANMTLLNPRSFPLLQNAYDNTDLSRLNAKAQKNELLFAVTSAYYQVHTAKEIIAVYRENLALAAEFVRSSEARLKAGQGTNIDVLRAKLAEMSAQKSLDNALDGLASAKTALAYLIGAEGEEIDIAGPEQVAPADLDTRGLQEKALSSRVEVRAAEIQEQMAERSRVETWLKWLPTFDVTYAWSWSSAAGFSGENTSWALIFGARWNLFDGGGRIFESKSRSSQIRMAENSLAQTRREIREQVEQLAISVRKQQRNVDLTDRQVEMAEENHRQVARQYAVGLTTSLELHDAETELANVKVSRVIERLNYDIAMLTLEKSIGEYSSLSNVAPR
jgi:outer membrane protein TolC